MKVSIVLLRMRAIYEMGNDTKNENLFLLGQKGAYDVCDIIIRLQCNRTYQSLMFPTKSIGLEGKVIYIGEHS